MNASASFKLKVPTWDAGDVRPKNNVCKCPVCSLRKEFGLKPLHNIKMRPAASATIATPPVSPSLLQFGVKKLSLNLNAALAPIAATVKDDEVPLAKRMRPSPVSDEQNTEVKNNLPRFSFNSDPATTDENNNSSSPRVFKINLSPVVAVAPKTLALGEEVLAISPKITQIKLKL
jgi:hypothetical protein